MSFENDYGIIDSSDEEVYIGPATDKEKSLILNIRKTIEIVIEPPVIRIMDATVDEDTVTKDKTNLQTESILSKSTENLDLAAFENGLPKPNIPKIGSDELDDTLTRMEKLLAISDNTDADSDVHNLLLKANPFQKSSDTPVTSPSTVYATPRDSVDSRFSFISCDAVLSPKCDLGVPFSIEEEPELEVSTVEEMKVSPKARNRKTSTPIAKRESIGTPASESHSKKESTPLRSSGNIPSPSADRFATPFSSPAVKLSEKKGTARRTPVTKTAVHVSNSVSGTPQNFTTPPRTPSSGTFVKSSSASRHVRARTPSSLTKKVAQKLFSETSRIPKSATNPRLANIVSPIGRYINERPAPNLIRKIRPPTISLTAFSNDRRLSANKSLNSSIGNASVTSNGGKENSDPKSQSIVNSYMRPSAFSLPPVHRTKPDGSKIEDASKPYQALPKGKIGRLMAPNLKYHLQKHAGRVHVGNAEVSVLLSKPAENNNK